MESDGEEEEASLQLKHLALQVAKALKGTGRLLCLRTPRCAVVVMRGAGVDLEAGADLSQLVRND